VASFQLPYFLLLFARLLLLFLTPSKEQTLLKQGCWLLFTLFVAELYQDYLTQIMADSDLHAAIDTKEKLVTAMKMGRIKVYRDKKITMHRGLLETDDPDLHYIANFSIPYEGWQESISIFEKANSNPKRPMAAEFHSRLLLECHHVALRPDLYHLPPEGRAGGSSLLTERPVAFIFQKGDPRGLKAKFNLLLSKVQTAGLIGHWNTLARYKIFVDKQDSDGSQTSSNRPASSNDVTKLESSNGADGLQIGMRHFYAIFPIEAGLLFGAICAFGRDLYLRHHQSNERLFKIVR
jgi:hypothetical protein